MLHQPADEAFEQARPARDPGEADGGAAPPGILLWGATTEEGILAVELGGEADHFTCVSLRDLLSRAAEEGHRHLVLDTARVTFADSGLLAALAPWYRLGHQVTWVSPSRTVRLLLETIGEGPSGPPLGPRRGSTAIPDEGSGRGD